MRVILAGLSTCAIVFLAVAVLYGPLEGKVSDMTAVILIVTTFFLAAAASCIVFNLRNERWPYQTTEEMESQGLIESAEFRAKRAFRVEEYEGEGPHYFLELDDGSVLYLNGQYLYDYEPIDDAESSQEAVFPCTDFIVKSHKSEHYVVEIIPSSTPLEIEEVAPAFYERNHRSQTLRTIPSDGDIIRDKSYEQIKREWLAN